MKETNMTKSQRVVINVIKHRK